MESPPEINIREEELHLSPFHDLIHDVWRVIANACGSAEIRPPLPRDRHPSERSDFSK